MLIVRNTTEADMATFLRVLRGISNTLRLALPKIGAGWMFALLTSNFNRVAIFDLGIAAVIITVMISMHNFLSPFQVVFGRMSDRIRFWDSDVRRIFSLVVCWQASYLWHYPVWQWP